MIGAQGCNTKFAIWVPDLLVPDELRDRTSSLQEECEIQSYFLMWSCICGAVGVLGRSAPKYECPHRRRRKSKGGVIGNPTDGLDRSRFPSLKFKTNKIDFPSILR